MSLKTHLLICTIKYPLEANVNIQMNKSNKPVTHNPKKPYLFVIVPNLDRLIITTASHHALFSIPRGFIDDTCMASQFLKQFTSILIPYINYSILHADTVVVIQTVTQRSIRENIPLNHQQRDYCRQSLL